MATTAEISTSSSTDAVGKHLIDRLFPDVGFADFLVDVYPRQRCVAHGDLGRLAPDLDTGVLTNLRPEDVLRQLDAAASVIAYERLGGAEKQRPVAAGEALDWYERGASISIEVAEGLVPGLERMNVQLAAELGLPDARAAAIVVSPPGSEVPVHFDGLELLVVQFVGRKTWRLAENRDVDHPDFAFFPSEGGPGPRGGRASRSQPVPPDAFDTVDLTPGSALFLPRGTWHATRAIEPTVNIVFRLLTPMAATIVGRAIEAALRETAQWRVPIAGVAGPAPVQRLAALGLRPLLPQLVAAIEATQTMSADWTIEAFLRERR